MADVRIIDTTELHGRLADGEAIQILDVRTSEEFAGGHIEGSILIPYDQVIGWPEALDPDLPTAIICKAGVRAAHAAAMLDQATSGVLYLVARGGVGDWPGLGERRGLGRGGVHGR